MTILYWTIIVTAGLIIGSFLNVIIFRGPSLWGLVDDTEQARGTLALPRSYCPQCRAQIRPIHLVPLFGFALLRGKCADCSAPISWRYPVIELAGAAIAIVAASIYGLTPAGALAALFGWILLALGTIDLDTGYLPDALTLPLGAIGLAASVGDLFVDIPSSIIGAVAGYGFFWAMGAAYRHWRGIEALGLGDAKLLGALGAWVGWQSLPIIILIGSLLTLAMVAITAKGRKKIRSETELPFGPGLCIAGYALFMAAPMLSASVWPQ